MNRFNTTLSAGLFACAAVGAGLVAHHDANAQSQSADKTQVVPKKEDLTPRKPSAGVLDDNTQRAHDRDRDGAKTGPQSSTATGGLSASAEREAGSSPGEVRDWNAIDANKDNLISPEEMEKALEKTGPQARKSTSKQ